jgi:alpha-galactosidase
VRDLWTHADRGAFTGEFSADVPSHGVVMIKIAK